MKFFSKKIFENSEILPITKNGFCFLSRKQLNLLGYLFKVTNCDLEIETRTGFAVKNFDHKREKHEQSDKITKFTASNAK